MKQCKCGVDFDLTQKQKNWQDKVLLLPENCCTECQDYLQKAMRDNLAQTEKYERHQTLMLQQTNEAAARKIMRILKHKGNRV